MSSHRVLFNKFRKKSIKLQKTAAQTEVRPIPNHKCNLPVLDNISSYRIYQGAFVLWRRRLWKWITVSPYSPDSKRYLKSAALIHDEELRHMDHHPNMIHPFSQFRYVWEMFMLCVWFSQFICIPIVMATEHFLDAVFYVYMLICGFCHVDIVMWFCTGYYDHVKQSVVMKVRNVAIRYIFSFFFFDLITSQPWPLYIHLFLDKSYQYLTAILLLRMVRLPTLITYLHRLSERTGFATSNMRLITFIIWIGVLLIWTTSVVYMVIIVTFSRSPFATHFKDFPMLMTTFRVARYLMVVGITEKINTSSMMMLIQILTIAVGSILQIIMLAKVMQFYQKRSASRNKYNNLLEEMGEYMKYKELPLRLRNKILHYVDFKFQKHIFREEDVLSNLSSVLKHDILLQRCQTMVERVEFFKDLPQQVIVRIVTKLRSEIFLPNDVIVLAGYTGHAMYFIYMGTVAVYTGGGKEICHLDDGGHFGEISLVINEPRVATVIAVKECELFRLSRKDFQEAIEPYPEINKKIRLSALSRLENTLQIMTEDEDAQIPQTVSDKSDRSYPMLYE